MILRVGIIGSRSFTDYTLLKHKFFLYFGGHLDTGGEITIVSGGAQGADSLGKELARIHKFSYVEFLPDYERYGKYQAPLIRNEDIILSCDCALVFWNGEMKSGTRNALNWAKKYKKDTIIIYF